MFVALDLPRASPGLSEDETALTLEVHHRLDAAEPVWRRLERDARLFAFQGFGWQQAWLRHFQARERVSPCIVTVHHGGRPIMLLPLGVQDRFGLRSLVFLGGGVTDYHAPILAPGWEAALGEGGFAALWRRILDALPPVDLIAFERMPAQVEGLANPFVGLPNATASGQAYAIRLPESLDAYRRTLRSGFVADTRRKRRRLSELGSLRHLVATSSEEAEATLDAMIERKTRRFAETQAPNCFAHPEYRAFYAALCHADLGEARTHASRLMVGDETVAAHWGLTHRGRFYYLMIGWSGGEWARYSVGRVMIEELADSAIAEGHAVLDLTVGDEAYKNDWANEHLTLFRVEEARSVKGRAWLAVLAAREELRARAKRIGWLRNAVRRVMGRKPLAA